MTLENTGLSRRKLLRTTAIGVPAAGLLAFGSTLVTAPSANAVETDGWWGSETTQGLQRFLNVIASEDWVGNLLHGDDLLVVDGKIDSQPSSMQAHCAAATSGWEWVPDDQAGGSPTLMKMMMWMTSMRGVTMNINIDRARFYVNSRKYMTEHATELQARYGLVKDGQLDGPSLTVQRLQEEINQTIN